MNRVLTLLLLSFQSLGPTSASASQEAPGLEDRIARLASELSSESVETRERAAHELVGIGRPALEPMKRLAESAKDPEVRGRAAEIAKKVEFALRPKIIARFFFGKKEKAVEGDWKGEEWIRKAAAFDGYTKLIQVGSLESSDVSDKRRTLYPDTPSNKPGGIYVWGQIVEQTSDKAVIEISCSVKSWRSGKYVLDQEKPRLLIRLSDQSPLEDLFLALELKGNSPAKAREDKNREK
jgi:hypothetical protein